MTTQNPDAAHTTTRKFRVPDPFWDAYGTVCARLGFERSEDLLNHIRTVVREHGTAEEVALLEQGERELAERRARKGGRPRKQTAE
ncbi:hypothetical protein [Streptosporangium jomthongense]|uniref:CopG family transcriptional regulator n=1 Tax=Streptosporangium jomthongense TaxID=1193683 RepID=A0ABV8FF40_9ACTN